MNPAPVPPQPRRRAQRGGLTMKELLVVVAIIGVLAAIIFPFVCGIPQHPRGFVEGSNLRTIGQAMLATETDHPGTLSSANPPDIYALAAQLARASGLNDPKLWLSRIDPNFPLPADLPSSIVEATSAAYGIKPINPKFQGLPLAFAVALFPPGTDITTLPALTPLAWTRGLQPDGKWSKTFAPYGDSHGFIIFAGGNLEKYDSIGGKLVKFGTGQPTSDIREALPPGTRISEFTPKR